jgi:hypothetical protein
MHHKFPHLAVGVNKNLLRLAITLLVWFRYWTWGYNPNVLIRGRINLQPLKSD